MVAMCDPAEVEAQWQRKGGEYDGHVVGTDSYAQQHQDVQHAQRGETRTSARDGWHTGNMMPDQIGDVHDS